MLLKFAKSKSAISYLLPIPAGLLFWMKELLNPKVYPYYAGEPEGLLFQPINKLLQPCVTLQSILALTVIIILAYMIQHTNNHYNFIRYRSYIPALIFIIIVSGFTDMHCLHPVYFSSIFFIIAVYRLFDIHEKIKPYSASFDTGFLLGVAALFYLNAIMLFPAFILGLTILSFEKRWREYILIITGMLLPVIFAISYGILTDQVLEILKVMEQSILTVNNHFNKNINLLIYLSYLTFLTILGSLKILKQYDHEKVSTRKYFTVLFLLFVNSALIFLLIPSASQEMLIISSIPVTFLLSNFFIFIKSRLWGEFLFFLLIAGIVTLQIIS